MKLEYFIVSFLWFILLQVMEILVELAVKWFLVYNLQDAIREKSNGYENCCGRIQVADFMVLFTNNIACNHTKGHRCSSEGVNRCKRQKKRQTINGFSGGKGSLVAW